MAGRLGIEGFAIQCGVCGGLCWCIVRVNRADEIDACTGLFASNRREEADTGGNSYIGNNRS